MPRWGRASVALPSRVSDVNFAPLGPIARSWTNLFPLQSTGDDKMTLPPGRFDYATINDRPIIKWPNNARVAFWVAPNMEHFEYLPENRPAQPDIPHYSRMDYGNRVGFWRMLEVLNKHKVRACCCLNLEILDHLPEI